MRLYTLHGKENPIHLLSEKKQRGLSPNFHIHVSCIMYVEAIVYTTLQRKSDLCTLRKETARPQSQNFHIHASVCDLYIPLIVPPIFLQQNRQTDR
jgi:hypothetical protein